MSKDMKNVILATAIASTVILSGCGNAKNEAAISAIKSQMYDPESLQVNEIKEVSVCQQFLPEGTDYKLVKMNINGKNRLGGFTGKKTVYYNPRKDRIEPFDTWMINNVNSEFMGFMDEETTSSLYEMNKKLCKSLTGV